MLSPFTVTLFNVILVADGELDDILPFNVSELAVPLKSASISNFMSLVNVISPRFLASFALVYKSKSALVALTTNLSVA